MPQGEIINATTDPVLHGQNITVKCRDRYEMQLSHEMPVCYNGTWTHVPICVPGEFAAGPLKKEIDLKASVLRYKCSAFLLGTSVVL